MPVPPLGLNQFPQLTFTRSCTPLCYELIQLGWRDFTGFSPRIQQFSSRFRRELLNSLRESSNSRRMFSNSRRRIRRELLILQKITTNREKRKVNLVATENWTILCCDENSYSRWDENWPILCCEENSNSRRDEICPILCCEENSNSRRDEICPILCCDENSNSRRDEIYPILYNLENMYQITPHGTPLNLFLLLHQLEYNSRRPLWHFEIGWGMNKLTHRVLWMCVRAFT